MQSAFWDDKQAARRSAARNLDLQNVHCFQPVKCRKAALDWGV